MSEKKKQLHVSGLNMLNFCGEQYRRRYEEGEKIPPGVAAHVGTATDKGVTLNLGNKITNNELLPKDAVLQEARDAFDIAWDTGVLLDDDERRLGEKKVKAEAVDKTLRFSVLHYTEMAPILNPIQVQWGWTIKLDGYPVDLAGTADILEEEDGELVIDDTKTTARSKSQREADDSLQLTTYDLAAVINLKRKPKEARLHVLVDTKKPKAEILRTTRTERDHNVLYHRVENAVEVMEKGSYVPVKAGDPLCSPRFCGFYSTCRYVNANPVQISIAA